MKHFFLGGRELPFAKQRQKLTSVTNTAVGKASPHCRKIGFATLFAIVCLQTSVYTQDTLQADKIIAFEVGDKLPAPLWAADQLVVNHPKSATTIKLSDLADGKLVALYVWSSWCGSCLKKFPVLVNLKEIHNTDAVFILLNLPTSNDSPERAAFAIEKANRYQSIKLDIPSIVDSRHWQDFLPHHSLGSILLFDANGSFLGQVPPEGINELGVAVFLKSYMKGKVQ